MPVTDSLQRARFQRERGFTLIELMVVIVILAMAAALVIPRLPSTEGTKLKTSAANLASALRFLNDQATLTKGVYRLHFNLADNGFSAAKLSQQGEELPPDDQFMNRKFIEDGISIQDVVAPRLGLVTEGEAIVALGPAGLPEPLVVHLKGGDKHFTVTAFPNGGRVVVQDGYQELGTDDLKETGK
ncbi:type II secretion system protein [Geomesophilobacter sediminis]|uniref:Type II secretion system protein n=1 Tax=Geomesophilobacter sediminis TaxID=2798584 RepID=A0A8J7M119_9BACT|nr:type II secretion system protein [Geomesophilobacter sediminis]MBJ6726631.1 type II secretion system protein [Geomesophilobacter sediminis]